MPRVAISIGQPDPDGACVSGDLETIADLGSEIRGHGFDKATTGWSSNKTELRIGSAPCYATRRQAGEVENRIDWSAQNPRCTKAALIPGNDLDCVVGFIVAGAI